MTTVSQWFKNLPIITKFYFFTSLVVTGAVGFSLVQRTTLELSLPLATQKYEAWRVITCFLCFGPHWLAAVTQLFILQHYLAATEREQFPGNRGAADFVFMLTLGMSALIAIASAWPAFNIRFPGPALVAMVIYVWSRRDARADTYFCGLTVSRWHVPFILLVLSFLFNLSWNSIVFGIVVGHIYHFLADIVPRTYGVRLVQCPYFIYRHFDEGNVGVSWARGSGHRLDS